MFSLAEPSSSIVILGLEPGIHVDGRAKPGPDEEKTGESP